LSKTSDERGQLGDRTGPPPAPPEVEAPPYHKEDERQPGLLAVLRETVVLVALAVLLAVVFKTFLVAAFYIPSGSMESTLNISDRVLVEKVSYRFGDIEHGDVVVFVHEEAGVATPGPSNPVAGFFSSLGQAIGVVQLFVMGDNRSNSQDSRAFGPINESDVVGRAFVRIWPLNHTGWLRRDR
jgi:signal peptidase I